MPDPTITGKPLDPQSDAVLKEILTACGLTSANVTSVGRSVEDQARIMYGNCLEHGVAAQLGLYAAAGDQVIGVYEQYHATVTRAAVEALMADKIREVGPGKVSHHISDANHYVFDVAPSSIPPEKHDEFVRVATSHPRVSKFLKPPADPAFHLEVTKLVGVTS